MNLDYFLFLEKEYEKILVHLTEIINIYESLISKTNEGRLQQELNFIYEQYLSEKKNIIDKIFICKNKIDSLCCHKYISDLIDITPEKSENITYCVFCGSTKNN